MPSARQSWTDDDFEHLSWHDNYVYGFALREGDDGAGELTIDLDFITQWLCPAPASDTFRFLLAPATLTFRAVRDLRIEVDYASCAMGPSSIDGIDREVITHPSGRNGYRWRIPVNFPGGQITFIADGFQQVLRADPVESSELCLSAEARTAGSIHHIDITVSDLGRSTAFYDRILPRMGFRRSPDVPEGPIWAGTHSEIGLTPARATSRRDHDRYSPGLHHLAFSAPDRAAVDDVHARLVALGVEVLDPPADYPQYASGYYAVFFADPDGIKLEYAFTPRWST